MQKLNETEHFYRLHFRFDKFNDEKSFSQPNLEKKRKQIKKFLTIPFNSYVPTNIMYFLIDGMKHGKKKVFNYN